MSAVITPKEVARVAALSRLGLSAEEIETSTENLAGILGHFTVIQKEDTSAIPEATNMSGLENVVRPDEVDQIALCTPEAVLQNVPHVQGRHIKVKAVFEEESL
jgi:aspartyl/glutamyl-tRNA(Asn/Gln) amidotransferase C subunit